MGATYRPRIVGTWPSAIPAVVVDGSNPHRRWPGVSSRIILYSFIDLVMMEGWFGLAARGDREICCGMNQARVARYGNTIVYPIPYSCFVAAAMVVQYFTHYISAALSKVAGLRTFREVFFASRTTVNRCLKNHVAKWIKLR